MRIRFSVVILTYNRLATLRQTLAAVLAQDYVDYDVIVVDDGSPDQTAALVRSEFPSVRYFKQKNAGPATARNCGIAKATGEIIAFTDDDCVPPVNWLTRLADGFRRYPTVTGVGGRLLAPPEVRATNLLAQYETYAVEVLAQARDTETVGGFACPAGGTNNLAYRREALQAVHGFDQAFSYAAGEDADLKWRLAQTGAQFLYLPLTVLHLQPYTWPAFRRQQTTRGKGVVYFNRKWGGLPSRRRVLARFGYCSWLALKRLPTYRPRALLVPALEEARCYTVGQWQALKEINA